MRRLLTLFLALGLLASPNISLGQDVVLIDYVGFGWETGGIPSSDPGDVLKVLAVATTIDPLFGVDLGTEEVTIYIYDLVSVSAVYNAFLQTTIIDYTGGTMEVYSDPSNNHDWGTNPPNPQLSTFTDGTLLLGGDFSYFTLFLGDNGAGAYEGNVDGVGGTVAEACDTDCAFTFGGAFTRDVNAQIPIGFDLQIDGTLEVDRAISNESTNWGALKAQYNN